MDSIIFNSSDPFNFSYWSNPNHFNIIGYDPSIFWDADGAAYLTGAQATSTGTAIALARFNPLTGGYLGPTTYPYNGTGIGTPEGPHGHIGRSLCDNSRRSW
ncbi:Glycoside hydrolase family 43 [Diaporthe eres]|nr:Glycoside hydrolase family 43 [Diaporthe eres]